MERTLAARAQILTETPTTAIIVAVWNRADITARFLAQLRPYLDEVNELIVVDDHSTDRTPSILEWWRSRLEDKMTVVRNRQLNLGFGPSSNRGASLATSDILIFVNNDVEIRGSFIAPTVKKLMEASESLVTVDLIDWNGGWNQFEDQIIPYAGGWYLGIWKRVWDRLGGFDERFVPCDYEDVDLSYRATQAEIQLISLNLPLMHIGGVSASQHRREEITHKNRRLFMEKWGLSD